MLHEEHVVERRFLVQIRDHVYRDWPSSKITTGFLETDEAKSVRVRIVAHDTGTEDIYMTVTHGRGAKRRKLNEDISIGTARLLLKTCSPRVTHKRRYGNGNMRVDIFDKLLDGVQIVEFKDVELDEDIPKPDWIESWREVTGKLTNYSLAELSARRKVEDSTKPIHESLHEDVPRIVITGGPGSGKSTIIDEAVNRFGDIVHCVPEVATIVINDLGLVPPANDPTAMLAFQRTVARTQRIFEDGAALHARHIGKKALLQDRGEIDGAAYMEAGLEDLELVSGLEYKHLFDRYDLVICLEVPPEDIYNKIKGNNTARREDHSEAHDLGTAIQRVWSLHPNYHLIGNYDGNWDEKQNEVFRLIEAFLTLKAT